MSFGRRSGRILALVVAVSIAALWAYALWGPTKKDPPGLLADTSYATQFESVCTDAAAQIGALPPAYATRESGARAEVIAEAKRCIETGEKKVILTALCGHGHFDMGAYERYLSGEMVDYELSAERIDAALGNLPVNVLPAGPPEISGGLRRRRLAP